MEEVDEALLQRVSAGAVGLPHEDHIVHTLGQHNVAHPTHAVHIGIVNLQRCSSSSVLQGWNLLQRRPGALTQRVAASAWASSCKMLENELRRKSLNAAAPA